jgi:hypothetical protein
MNSSQAVTSQQERLFFVWEEIKIFSAFWIKKAVPLHATEALGVEGV